MAKSKNFIHYLQIKVFLCLPFQRPEAVFFKAVSFSSNSEARAAKEAAFKRLLQDTHLPSRKFCETSGPVSSRDSPTHSMEKTESLLTISATQSILFTSLSPQNQYEPRNLADGIQKTKYE
jgi:hypothetical protein